MSAAARMRLAAEAAEAAEAAKHRKPLILKAAVKQVEVAPPPPEMAFLESVGARIERCEKEGQIDLAVSIYRTALPMFTSALEHGGPYTGTILAVSEPRPHSHAHAHGPSPHAYTRRCNLAGARGGICDPQDGIQAAQGKGRERHDQGQRS